MDQEETAEKKPEKKPETPAVKAARERYEALKSQSNKMPTERAELARYAELSNSEHDRLDREGEEALKLEAHIREADARAALAPDVAARTSIECIYDWPTHKATGGRGLIVVRQLDSDAAAAAMRPAAKVGAEGMALFDNSPETQVKNLVACALYPDPGDVQLMCSESPVFVSLVNETIMRLSGMAASRTVEKSRG